MFEMNENKKTEEKLSFIVRSCVKKRSDFLLTASVSKMVRIAIDFQEEERLSEEVKLYSCLYDFHTVQPMLAWKKNDKRRRIFVH